MRPLDLHTIRLDGTSMIEASAGTGKTWTIAALYVLLLLETRLAPDEILVVTYTKAATAELKERIRQRIAATLEMYRTGRPPADDLLEQVLHRSRPQEPATALERLTHALRAFDDAAIYTIHGFCQRALSENSFECGSLFETEMVTSQDELVRQVCADYWRTRVLVEPAMFVRMLASERITPERLAEPLRGHFQNGTVRLVPPGHAADLAPHQDALDRIYSRLQALWRTDRERITCAITAARLHQASYSPRQVERAAQQLTSWLDAGDPAARCDRLAFFSTAQLAARMTGQSPAPPAHEFFDLCQACLEASDGLQIAFRQRLLHHRHGLKTWLERELADRKQRLNQRCYDDLLIDLHRSLEETPDNLLAKRLSERFRATLIDEFQDTDPLQWQIFAQIAGASPTPYPLLLIGDPKQAIYSFRGADIHAYLDAGRSVLPEKRLTLTDNFRSVPPLVRALNALYRQAPDPFRHEGIGYHQVTARRSGSDTLSIDGRPVERPLEIRLHGRSEAGRAESKGRAGNAIVAGLADDIAALLQPGRCGIVRQGAFRPLAANDIAVLVRSHRHAELVRTALAGRGIPSVQQGSSTVYATPEALDLLAILRAAAEPAREALVREALLTDAIGATMAEVARFRDYPAEEREWEEWLVRFRTLGAALRTDGIMVFFGRLLGDCGVRQRALGRSGGERALTNLQHCCELLHRFETEQGINPEQTIRQLERAISGDRRDDAALLRLESDEDAVTIATIHASKGLQYPLVFLPFAWDTPRPRGQQVIFHDDEGHLTIDLAGDARNSRQAEQELDAESARLLYVALTRAESYCQVAWGCISGAIESPLGRLLQDEHLRAPKAFAAASDQELYEDLLRLDRASDGSIAVTMAPSDAVDAALSPARPVPGTLVARTLKRPTPDDWRVASFSAMMAGSEHHFQPRDVDPAGPEPPGPAENAAPGADIHGFPRGAGAGTCLHDIFERLDFAGLDSFDIAGLCRERLAANGFDTRWSDTLARMVATVCHIPLLPADAPGLHLARLQPGAWQCEMEFYLPLRLTSPASLQRLFAGEPGWGGHPEFTGQLDRLAFRPVRGLLQGFIDMVFEHDGRYYIIDWKSNHLGMGAGDYTTDRMAHAMASHGYILQYHLYTLALDSLLRLRLPGYDYERHFGGALYLFLRGVSPAHPGCGVFAGRPSEEFIRRGRTALLELPAGCVPPAMMIS